MQSCIMPFHCSPVEMRNRVLIASGNDWKFETWLIMSVGPGLKSA